MPMRAIVMSLVAVTLVMLALPYVAAADCGDRIVLSATADGAAVVASGVAYVGSLEAGAQHTFILPMDAPGPDGTPLLVFTTGPPAGPATPRGGPGTRPIPAAQR